VKLFIIISVIVFAALFSVWIFLTAFGSKKRESMELEALRKKRKRGNE